jgi:DNA-binding Lrp family transcriptional regulator
MHAMTLSRGNLEDLMQTDDLEAQLIRALQEDGRASIRSLAESLGQTRATIATRLRTMIGDGTVRIVAAVDPALLGQHVIAHVSIRTHGPAADVADQLRGRPETVFVSAVGGRHDIVIEVWTGSMPELHAVLADVRTMAGVTEIDTLVYTAVEKGFFVSEFRGEADIDELDAALIDRLQHDGRATFRELGHVVRLSPSAVATRVQRLIDGGVIKISAVEARGLTHRQLSMGIGLNVSHGDDEVISALRAMGSVDFAVRTLGRFDVVATLVAPTAGALYASLERLRALPGVTAAEAWLHLAVLKEDYARTLGATRGTATRRRRAR